MLRFVTDLLFHGVVQTTVVSVGSGLRRSLRRSALIHVRCACCSCFALRAPNPPGASGGEWCYIEPRAGCAAWQVLCCVAGACGSWEVG